MENNVTLSGGKLYIKPQGASNFRYFGSTDSMSVSTESEKKEHLSTEDAIPVTDAEVVTKQSAKISWSSADMSAQMMAFAFRGEVDEIEGAKTLDITLKDDDSYPLIIPTSGYGASKVVETALKEGEDFNFDSRSGNIEIIKKPANLTLKFTFTGAKKSLSFNAFKSAKTIASLMFISNAASGKSFKYEFFRVNIAQEGDFALKGEEFMQVSFSGSVLKDNSRPNGEQFFKVTQLP
nr:MAG TPA: hypothetical protein [Caudoviricetes sp.]